MRMCFQTWQDIYCGREFSAVHLVYVRCTISNDPCVVLNVEPQKPMYSTSSAI